MGSPVPYTEIMRRIEELESDLRERRDEAFRIQLRLTELENRVEDVWFNLKLKKRKVKRE